MRQGRMDNTYSGMVNEVLFARIDKEAKLTEIECQNQCQNDTFFVER